MLQKPCGWRLFGPKWPDVYLLSSSCGSSLLNARLLVCVGCQRQLHLSLFTRGANCTRAMRSLVGDTSVSNRELSSSTPTHRLLYADTQCRGRLNNSCRGQSIPRRGNSSGGRRSRCQLCGRWSTAPGASADQLACSWVIPPERGEKYTAGCHGGRDRVNVLARGGVACFGAPFSAPGLLC